MFFERGIQSSTRHRRLRYLLLFSLRTALVLLLVLAFANPFIRLASHGANSKLLLVVVDDSFSMKAGSRFADAKQAALQVLASRPKSQRAEVMALGGRLAVLTQPIQDGAALRSAVESIQPGDSRANLGELAHGVRALAETVRTPVELHLFSDMQKTGMPANFADMELPANVSVVLHPVGTAASPNWTVESVNAPAQVADPKDTKEIACTGSDRRLWNSRCVEDCLSAGQRQNHRHPQMEIPADGRQQLSFNLSMCLTASTTARSESTPPMAFPRTM